MLSPSTTVVCAAVGNEAVLLDTVSGVYYGLNPLGLKVWTRLGELATLGEIHEEIRVASGAPSAVIWKDLLGYCRVLEQNALLSVGTSAE